MSEFKKNTIEELNSSLSDALKDNVEEQIFLAASAVVKFWSDYLYHDSALDDAKFELLKELKELEPTPLHRALAVSRIVNSDFWDGNKDNLSEVHPNYKTQILNAAKYIYETSQTDAEFFGDES